MQDMQKTIYLVVGKKVRQAEARIVGKIAKVQTAYGVLEFSRYYLTERAAKLAITKKRKQRSKHEDA